MNSPKNSPRSAGHEGQRGGFAMGLIVGLLVGLALALAVALYVTKVPIPFVNKVPQRTADQDAAETQKNRNWDPNAPLSGKNPARAGAASGAAVAPPTSAVPATPASAATTSAAAPAGKASAPKSTRDPAAILADKAPAKALAPGADPFTYYVQAGAYGRAEDAEQQRAKLAIMGLESKVTEREQSGRTVYRVRVGPFDKKADADSTKEKLGESSVEAALVRVQR